MRIMPHPSALGTTDIRNICLHGDKLHADISLEDKGVFLVLLSSRNHDEFLLKRFVQFENGFNNLQLLTGFLERGQYMLSVIKGNTVLKHVFSI